MRKFSDCDSCVFDGVESEVCSECNDADQWEEDPERLNDEVSEVLKIVDETKHNHPMISVEETEGTTVA